MASAAMPTDSMGDWGHNIWNPPLDMLAEYRTGPVLLGFLQDEEAGRVGITSHFAVDVMSPTVLAPTENSKDIWEVLRVEREPNAVGRI